MVIGHALPLESYLLKPVQRIMKYHLLFRVGLLFSLFCCILGLLFDGKLIFTVNSSFSFLKRNCCLNRWKKALLKTRSHMSDIFLQKFLPIPGKCTRSFKRRTQTPKKHLILRALEQHLTDWLNVICLIVTFTLLLGHLETLWRTWEGV